MLALKMLAGAYLAFGASVAAATTVHFAGELPVGLAKIIGALAFRAVHSPMGGLGQHPGHRCACGVDVLVYLPPAGAAGSRGMTPATLCRLRPEMERT